MSRYVFDLETDGLLHTLTTIHSLVLKDVDTGRVHSFKQHIDPVDYNIADGLRRLMDAEEIIGHNIIKFDIPAIKKLYPWFEIAKEKVTDTIVVAKLLKSAVKEEDLKYINTGKYPKNLFGQQSLEAWGYRLGCWKGDYGTIKEAEARKLGITDEAEIIKHVWGTWTPEMQEYCEQDVEVTTKLYQYLRKSGSGAFTKSLELEHQAAWLCAQIERNGIRFNVQKAQALYAELAGVREKLAVELKSLFISWFKPGKEFTPKRDSKKQHYTAGATFSRIELTEFNPRSRHHIANRLTFKYGWQPREFTNKGQVQIDEQILGELDYPEAKQLAELFLIQKRIDQLAEGDEAWLKHEKDGWLFHSINPNGAVTGRATHSHPNISQVPKVGSKYGQECRELFETVPGWILLGVDASSLELCCLSHYMSRYDGGDYGRAVTEGKEEDGTDAHSLNTKALGMDPQKLYVINGKQQKGRNCGKTFIYAFLYGAGDEKIGITVGVSDDEVTILIDRNCKRASIARKRLGREKRKITSKLVATLIKGALIKERFLEKTPALKKLREAVEAASKRGYLVAIDGRHVFIRSAHSALNTLLQGAGALICKKWIVETEKLLLAQGLKHGWDGDFAVLIWSHDEQQIAVRPGLDHMVVYAAAEKAMQMTEEFFGFKCPLTIGAAKTGNNWASTH